MEAAIERLAGALWGPWTAAVMLSAGLWIMAGTGFMPFRHFRAVWRGTLGSILRKSDKTGGVTPFQSLTTALAGTMGTGNLVGVAAALAVGGPGAVFWLWVSALFGMMTKYAEIVLALRFREKSSRGEYLGGPMYILRNGLRSPVLAKLYAALCLFAALGMGGAVQSGTMAGALGGLVPDTRYVGTFAALAVGLVLVGGVRRLAGLTELLMPLFSCLYAAAALLVVALHARALPGVFADIFADAFTGTAAAGGFAGATMAAALRSGMSRGVFSHEAGLGTASMAHSLSDAAHPVQQGLWGIAEVFVDSIVGCTATARRKSYSRFRRRCTAGPARRSPASQWCSRIRAY